MARRKQCIWEVGSVVSREEDPAHQASGAANLAQPFSTNASHYAPAHPSRTSSSPLPLFVLSPCLPVSLSPSLPLSLSLDALAPRGQRLTSSRRG
jgi:hypothetical protein